MNEARCIAPHHNSGVIAQRSIFPVKRKNSVYRAADCSISVLGRMQSSRAGHDTSSVRVQGALNKRSKYWQLEREWNHLQKGVDSDTEKGRQGATTWGCFFDRAYCEGFGLGKGSQADSHDSGQALHHEHGSGGC